MDCAADLDDRSLPDARPGVRSGSRREPDPGLASDPSPLPATAAVFAGHGETRLRRSWVVEHWRRHCVLGPRLDELMRAFHRCHPDRVPSGQASPGEVLEAAGWARATFSHRGPADPTTAVEVPASLGATPGPRRPSPERRSPSGPEEPQVDAAPTQQAAPGAGPAADPGAGGPQLSFGMDELDLLLAHHAERSALLQILDEAGQAFAIANGRIGVRYAAAGVTPEQVRLYSLPDGLDSLTMPVAWAVAYHAADAG